MTTLLGGTNAKTKNVAASLRYQTSQKGGVVPLVYGTAKLAVNLLDYQNFAASGGSGKGGKGGAVTGKSSSNTPTYSVDWIAGVCQGPIANWGLLWYNKTITTVEGAEFPVAGAPSKGKQSTTETGLSYLALGYDGQAADSYWTASYPANAIGYSGTAFITADDFKLGASPAFPNFNLEVFGIESGTAPNGCDANPASIVTDLLTNPRYGAEFPADRLDTGAFDDYSAYCNAAGLMLAPVYDTQQPASQMLAEIAALTNSAAVWSGGVLKIIPYGDMPLSATYTPIGFSGELTEGDLLTLTIGGFTGGPANLSHYLTANDIVSYEAAGAALCALVTGDGTLTDPGNTALAAAGIYATVTNTGLMIVSISGVTPVITTNGGGMTVGATSAPYTWTPNTTPIYSLGEDDFIVQESSVGAYLGVTPGGPALRLGAGPITGGFTDDPVHIARSTPADAMNMVQLQTTDRGTSYNPSVTEAFDQASIDLYGVRRDTSVKASAIVDPYFVATIAAQLVLQRQLLYRNTYTFQLGWKYILLEPMDLVQITDQRLGAQAITVRITAIEEDDEGLLSVTAEDWFGTPGPVLYPPANVPAFNGGVTSLGHGGGTATPYPKQGGASTASTPNYGTPAPAINPPLILEPTAALLIAQGQTSPYVAIGLSGGPNEAYSANWGGAAIYISLDGDTYAKFGEFTGRSTMGYTTADCGPGGTSLAVDLSESGGTLTSVSAALAAQAVSLCAVVTPGGALEFLSFTTATLAGANQYTLTGLYRGLYGTHAIDLPLGSQFLLMGADTFLEVLPSQFVGQSIYLKFPSFNIVGGGAQTLAEAEAYLYVPVGSSAVPGIFPQRVVGEGGTAAEIVSGAVQHDAMVPIESGETVRLNGIDPLQSN